MYKLALKNIDEIKKVSFLADGNFLPQELQSYYEFANRRAKKELVISVGISENIMAQTISEKSVIVDTLEDIFIATEIYGNIYLRFAAVFSPYQEDVISHDYYAPLIFTDIFDSEKNPEKFI